VNEAKCRAIVKERSHGICEICGAARGLQMHHRRNRSQRGRWEPQNILHLCVECHHSVTVHPKWATEMGWSIQGRVDGDSPETVPVLIRGQRCLLEDDGTVVWIPEAS
jgi:hypothetical protein